MQIDFEKTTRLYNENFPYLGVMFIQIKLSEVVHAQVPTRKLTWKYFLVWLNWKVFRRINFQINHAIETEKIEERELKVC